MSIFRPTKKKEFGSPSIESAIASLVDEAKLLENKRQKAKDYLGASDRKSTRLNSSHT